MHAGRIVFTQLMDFFPTHEFNRCVRRYRGNYKARRFSCRDQFLCMAFAQLTGRESLRDMSIRLCGPKSSTRYPDLLRRISYYADDIGRRFVFLTNNFTLPALTIAELYKSRWQVELFFKWIKQHLRIKAFYGTSIN
ncbi:MAG: DUF4372 domain-containing protein, partial [Anaerolineaceae bacterium]|nr:DUF4372 domain-containing protein [Anaerolineaceae bacterium]